MARPQTLQDTIPGLWRILKRFAPYIRKQRSLITLSMAALFGEIGLRLLEPLPLKFVFDEIFAQKAEGAIVPAPVLFGLSDSRLLLLCAFSILLIAGLRAIAAYWNTVGFALAGNRVLTEIRSLLYCHLQGLSLSFYDSARSGDLTLRIISDVGVLQEVVVTAFLPLVANFLVLLGMIGVMFWLNLQLALLSL
jgi:ATP-binding cassette, subfamily B, bacterial